MNRERHAQAAQTSRMRVEMDMVEEWCRAFEPKFYSSPNRTGDRIDGIEYHVELTEGTLFGSSRVRLELVVPEDYPAEIPRIYVPGLTIRDWDGNAHMYRGQGERHSHVHLLSRRLDGGPHARLHDDPLHRLAQQIRRVP